MKPLLASVKGKMITLESSVNGYVVEVVDVRGKYNRCFLHTDALSKFSTQFGNLKPGVDVKIKCSHDYDIYGTEILHIEHITPINK